MTDVQNEALPRPAFAEQNRGFMAQTFDAKPEPDDPVIPPVDHHVCIRELALQLRTTTPSGAETIADKILVHLDAIADPKVYDENQAKLQNEEDERTVVRKAERDKLKAKPEAEQA